MITTSDSKTSSTKLGKKSPPLARQSADGARLMIDRRFTALEKADPNTDVQAKEDV